MNKHIMAEIGLGAAILICIIWIAVNQYHKAVDNAVAEQAAQILKQSQDKLDQAMKDRDREYQQKQDERDEKYKQDTADMMARFAALNKMTPQQIVLKAPEYIPGLQGKPPIQIVGPNTEPAPVGSAIIPQESVQPIAQAILEGKQCSIDKKKCADDLVALQGKYDSDEADWKGKYDTKDQEAKNWEKAAKGGSFLSKAWGCAKIGGFGAAAGALPNDPNNRGRNALYGFGLTFGPCMFIKHR